MALKKTYTKKLLIIDIILFFLTGGIWLAVMLIRELYRLNRG